MSSIEDQIRASLSVKASILDSDVFIQKLKEAIDIITDSFKSGGTLFAIGNGGSAADAQHLVAEFMGRFRLEREPYPAISLTTNTSIITAWSNDYDYAGIFERQLRGLAKKGDVLISFSTSGNSENVLRAVKYSDSVGVKTISLLGNGGGLIGGKSDCEIIIPSEDTPRIQEAHVLLLHIMAEEVEKKLKEQHED